MLEGLEDKEEPEAGGEGGDVEWEGQDPEDPELLAEQEEDRHQDKGDSDSGDQGDGQVHNGNLGVDEGRREESRCYPQFGCSSIEPEDHPAVAWRVPPKSEPG